ncbi:MAG: hypothetical protein GQ569_07900 [Methylococcaceae bacterium]|nr:hypothetical protein [Methylococcaceae bacterium]
MAMKNWMDGISDDLLLKEIIMPGSHDAGMSKKNVASTGVLVGAAIGLAGIGGLGIGGYGANKGFKALGCTHDFDILGQCEAGSRFFDIRLTYTKSKTITHHTAGDSYTVGGTTGQTGLSILDDVHSFLSDNDSELVILRISHTYDKKTAEIFIKEINGHKLKTDNMLCTSNSNLVNRTIKELRGKAIIIFEEKLFFGRKGKTFPLMWESDQIYRGFHAFRQIKKDEAKKNRWGKLVQPDQKKIASYKQNVCGIMTCGGYSNSKDIKKVLAGQIKKVQAHKKHYNVYKPHLFVISWTQTGGDIRSNTMGKSGTHAKIIDLLKMLKKECGTNYWPQVVSMDFVNETSSTLIVGLNKISSNRTKAYPNIFT